MLLAFSFIAGGLNWPMEYLARVGSPELHPGAEHMPTLSAIAELLPAWRHFVLGIGTICGVSIFLVAATKVKDFEVLFGISLVGGLLLSFHAYLQDCVVLLLAFAIIISRSANKPLRGVMAIATTPPPCLLLLMGTPTSANFPIILFGILVLAACEKPVSLTEPAPQQPGKQAVAAR